jgi:predicted DNA-binding protein
LKEEPRDFIVPIRMNFEEKEKIKKRAEKTGKKVSTFIRNSALRL